MFPSSPPPRLPLDFEKSPWRFVFTSLCSCTRLIYSKDGKHHPLEKSLYLYPVDFRCIAMYLFDDVIRPLNNWALYKKKLLWGRSASPRNSTRWFRRKFNPWTFYPGSCGFACTARLLSSFKDGGDHSPSYLCVFQFWVEADDLEDDGHERKTCDLEAPKPCSRSLQRVCCRSTWDIR